MKVIQFADNRLVLTKRVVEIISRARVDLSDEKRTQRDIAEVLDIAQIPYTREVKLTKKDIVDFMVSDIALEIKLKTGASKMDVYRQLERYAESPQVAALVLVTNLSMGLPETINGKPTYFISLGKAWL